MESSSKLYGDRTEECQSSESGWTMYIGCSMDDDDGGGGDDGHGHGGARKKGALKDEDEDTDDSMTSDASSGPSHLHLQQDQTDGKLHNQESYKCSSKKNKKASRKKKKDGCEESRKKDESLVNEKTQKRGVITTVQSGNRAWFLGKRK